MNKPNMYDDFSLDYDRFVNWDARLSVEIPFLVSELSTLALESDQVVSILDAACGTGQHVIALSNRGFDCLGADFSAGMVDIARQNAKRANSNVIFKQAGFGQLSDTFHEKYFDGVVCLGNSLPHILDELTLTNTLADFRSVIRSGGKLILQNRNFDKVLAERSRWMPPETYREGDRTWVFARFYDFDQDDRITFNILILYSQERGDFHQRIVSTRLWPMEKDLLIGFLKEAGFGDIKIFGDLLGSTFEIEESGNLVIIGKAE